VTCEKLNFDGLVQKSSSSSTLPELTQKFWELICSPSFKWVVIGTENLEGLMGIVAPARHTLNWLQHLKAVNLITSSVIVNQNLMCWMYVSCDNAHIRQA
jgi:hypothetical protein